VFVTSRDAASAGMKYDAQNRRGRIAMVKDVKEMSNRKFAARLLLGFGGDQRLFMSLQTTES
jgi:hypothetical protein